MPKICQKYGQDMLKIFPRYTPKFCKVCGPYRPKNMPKMYPDAQDMPKIWVRHAQDMLNI